MTISKNIPILIVNEERMMTNDIFYYQSFILHSARLAQNRNLFGLF